MKQKIIFFASGSYNIPIIDMLKKHGLSLVVTTEKEGKFLDYLKKENLAFIISALKEEKDMELLKNEQATVGILASYGAIVPEKIIDIFPLGILNIHPSILPKYKGPSPIQTTILNGDKITGVSIIKLDEKIDHGPIVDQKTVELQGNETTFDLKNKLFGIGANMIEEILKQLENGQTIKAEPQKETNEKLTSKITRQSGFIDINNPPNPEMLDRMIRAYYRWPGVWTEYTLLGNKRRVKFLPDKKIQVEGKNVMSYKDFVNGYQNEAEEFLRKLALIS